MTFTNKDGVKYWAEQDEKGIWTVFSQGTKFPYKWEKRNEFDTGLMSREDAVHMAKLMAGVVVEEDPEAFYLSHQYKDGGESDPSHQYKVPRHLKEQFNNLNYQIQNADEGWIKNHPKEFKDMQDKLNSLVKKMNAEDGKELTGKELVGRRVRMIEMPDDPDPINPGEEGEVIGVDALGQAMVSWDSGRSLSLIPGIDKYEIISKKVWNVSFFDKDGEFIDETQIDEQNEDLAWILFAEFGHTKQPGMYVEWTEEWIDDDYDDDDEAKNGKKVKKKSKKKSVKAAAVKKRLHEYHVNIDYQTTDGLPETYTAIAMAKNEDEAIEKAEKIVKRKKNFMKLQGGSATRVKTMAADGKMFEESEKSTFDKKFLNFKNDLEAELFQKYGLLFEDTDMDNDQAKSYMASGKSISDIVSEIAVKNDLTPVSASADAVTRNIPSKAKKIAENGYICVVKDREGNEVGKYPVSYNDEKYVNDFLSAVGVRLKPGDTKEIVDA